MEILYFLIICFSIVGWVKILHFATGILFDIFDDDALLSNLGSYLLDLQDKGSFLAKAFICPYCLTFHLTTIAAVFYFSIGLLPLYYIPLIHPITFLIKWKF